MIISFKFIFFLVLYFQNNQVLGVGSGSTIVFAVERLGLYKNLLHTNFAISAFIIKLVAYNDIDH